MKIDPNMIIGTVVPETVKRVSGTGGAFEDVLKGLEADTTAMPDKVHAQFQQVAVSPQKLTALSTSEDALELLGRYSQAVSDPQMSLKGLAPMVDELESMKSRLDSASSFISDNDPLKGILSEVSSTLYGEVLRFRRGDLIG